MVFNANLYGLIESFERKHDMGRGEEALQEIQGQISSTDAADLNTSNPLNDVTVLYFAARANGNRGGLYAPVVQGLLEAKADPNGLSKNPIPGNEEKSSPLHIATLWGHKEIIRLLLENQANPNQPSSGLENTPLHIAATRTGDKYKEVLEILISNGANLDMKNKKGLTPLHEAIEAHHFEAVELLVEAGANLEATYKNEENQEEGNTLHHAIRKLASAKKEKKNTEKMEQIISFLRQKGVSTEGAKDLAKKEGVEKEYSEIYIRREADKEEEADEEEEKDFLEIEEGYFKSPERFSVINKGNPQAVLDENYFTLESKKK